jgi:hypothetical protein
LETLEGKNTTGNTYYVGVNIPDANTFTIVSAKNSFTQSTSEYTYTNAYTLTLSNFTVVATLDGNPPIGKAVGYTYYLLVNNVVKSTIVLDSSITPQTGNDSSSFAIASGDKIVVRAVLNPDAFKTDDPDDISFEWSVNVS